jgi:Leu/Phe-tRNA-protein transferase
MDIFWCVRAVVVGAVFLLLFRGAASARVCADLFSSGKFERALDVLPPELVRINFENPYERGILASPISSDPAENLEAVRQGVFFWRQREVNGQVVSHYRPTQRGILKVEVLEKRLRELGRPRSQVRKTLLWPAGQPFPGDEAWDLKSGALREKAVRIVEANPQVYLTLDEIKNSPHWQPAYRRKKMNEIVDGLKFVVTWNQDPFGVIERCARSRRAEGYQENWLTADVVRYYQHVHRLGLLQSFEIWDPSDLVDGRPRMVGGTFGLLVDNFFVGESVFRDHAEVNSASTGVGSKWRYPELGMVAIFYSTSFLKALGIRWMDVQTTSSNFSVNLGAEDISEVDFESLLRDARFHDDGTPREAIIPRREHWDLMGHPQFN